MKKVILLSLIATSLFLSSCGSKSKEDIVRRNIEYVLIPTMNNPRSYEFAALELINTISTNDVFDEIINIYYDNVRFEIELLNLRVDIGEELLRNDPLLQSAFSQRENERNRENVKSSIARMNDAKSRLSETISKIDELRIDIEERDVSHTFRFSYRGTNTMGAIVLNALYVQTDTSRDFNILHIAENKDDILCPIDIDYFVRIFEDLIPEFYDE